MSAPFFITGLPRSRTAWLANLFTWGDSFCYHDALPDCESLGELDIMLGGLPYLEIGLSDSSLLLIWRALVRRYPTSKWVLIRRDKREALRSFRRYFKEHPYSSMPQLEEGALSLVFDGYDFELSAIESARVNLPNLIHVIQFEELTNYDACRRLLRDVAKEHLTEERWKLLNSLRINTFSEGRTLVANEKFNQLLNECVLAGNGIDAIRRATAQCGAGSPLPECHAPELVHNESR